MKLLRELSALNEAYELPFHFGLANAGNIKKAIAALNAAKLKFDSDQNGGFTYFYFNSKKDLMAAAKAVKAVIDASKEDEWGSVKESKEGGYAATDVHFNPTDVSVLVVGNAPADAEYHGVNVVFGLADAVELVTADAIADKQAEQDRDKIIAVARKELDAEALEHLTAATKKLNQKAGVKEAVDFVELTKFSGKEIPHTAWPRGVKYKGQEVFQSIYEEPPIALVKAEEEMKKSADEKLDFQEVYLGYSPSKDVFIQGFDGWLGDDNCSPYIVFTMSENGKVKVVQKGYDITRHGEMWYSNKEGGHQVAKRRFPDLIDIRLD